MALRAGVNIWLAGGAALENPEISETLGTEGEIIGTSSSSLPTLLGFTGDTENGRAIAAELPVLQSTGGDEGQVVGVYLPALLGSASGESSAAGSSPAPPGPTDPGPATVVSELPSFFSSAGNEPTPDVSISISSVPTLKAGFIFGAPWWTGEVDEASLPALLGFAGEGSPARSIESFPGLIGEANARGDVASLVVALSGITGGLTDDEIRVIEGLQTNTVTSGTLAIVANELLSIQASMGTSLFSKIEINEQLVALALAAIPFNLDIVEALTLGDDPQTAVFKLVKAAEALSAVDDFDTQAVLLLSVAIALAIGDKAQTAYLLNLEELLQVVDENKANLKTAIETVEELLCVPLVSDNVIFTVLSEELLALDATVSTSAQLRIAVEEGLAVYVKFKVGDDVYQGWVMNAKNAGFSQYENFPFNSFAKLHGQVYAASDTGIYKLGGDTDAGDQIDARLKTGLLDLGSHKMKNVKAAYLGFTSDSRMILKVTVVDRGQKNEHWYEAIPSDANASRDGRITIQQGLRSRYWQFELANINGADFDLDEIDFTYNVLSRGYR